MTKLQAHIKNPATISVPLDQCLNCGQHINQIQDGLHNVDSPKSSTAVVAFESYVQNSRTQVFMRDALKEIYSLLYLGQLNQDLDGSALCVDCCLVFAQLYGLFHTFESRRKSDGFLGSTLKLAFKSVAAGNCSVADGAAQEIDSDEDGAGHQAAMETDPSDSFIEIQRFSSEQVSDADVAEDDDDDVEMPQTFDTPPSPDSTSDQDVEMPEKLNSGPASPINSSPASQVKAEPETEQFNPLESAASPHASLRARGQPKPNVAKESAAQGVNEKSKPKDGSRLEVDPAGKIDDKSAAGPDSSSVASNASSDAENDEEEPLEKPKSKPAKPPNKSVQVEDPVHVMADKIQLPPVPKPEPWPTVNVTADEPWDLWECEENIQIPIVPKIQPSSSESNATYDGPWDHSDVGAHDSDMEDLPSENDDETAQRILETRLATEKDANCNGNGSHLKDSNKNKKAKAGNCKTNPCTSKSSCDHENFLVHGVDDLEQLHPPPPPPPPTPPKVSKNNRGVKYSAKSNGTSEQRLKERKSWIMSRIAKRVMQPQKGNVVEDPCAVAIPPDGQSSSATKRRSPRGGGSGRKSGGVKAEKLSKKAAATAEAADVDERLYCTCQSPHGNNSAMIGCDYEGCQYKWFHFECLGIVMAPKGKWFCSECRDVRRRKAGASAAGKKEELQQQQQQQQLQN